MKNRTIWARWAAIGLSMMLCFGAAGCGKEEEAVSETGAEGETEEVEKEDTEKNAPSEEKETQTEKEEAGNRNEYDNSHIYSMGMPKDGNTNVTLSEDEFAYVGNYSVNVYLGDNYLIDHILNGDEEYTQYPQLFESAALYFDATLHLCYDNTAYISYGLEEKELYDQIYNWIDKGYVDAMKWALERVGIDDALWLQMVNDKGYTTADEAWDAIKEDMIMQFETFVRDSGWSTDEAEIGLTWKANGNEIELTADNGYTTSMIYGYSIYNPDEMKWEVDEKDSPTNTPIVIMFAKLK